MPEVDEPVPLTLARGQKLIVVYLRPAREPRHVAGIATISTPDKSLMVLVTVRRAAQRTNWVVVFHVAHR